MQYSDIHMYVNLVTNVFISVDDIGVFMSLPLIASLYLLGSSLFSMQWVEKRSPAARLHLHRPAVVSP